MALADYGDLPFGVEVQPIVGLLWTAWLILQRVMEGGEGPTAAFREITLADPVLGSCTSIVRVIQ
jgi:hypothetical protein